MDGNASKNLVTILPWSVRRRYSLSGLMVAVTAYSFLFGFLVVLQVPTLIILDIVAFVTAIAIAQAFLFRGRKPRLASSITGAVVAALLAGGQVYWLMLDPQYPEGVAWAPYAACLVGLNAGFLGAIVGYVVGAVIGLLCVGVEVLYRALNPDSRPSDRALEEVKRRTAEFDAGRMKGVSWEEVQASVSELLANRK